MPFFALAMVFVFLTRDIYEWGEHGSVEVRLRNEWRFRANVFISIAWAAYGAALVVAGFVRDRAGLRWAGLVVFALTLLKIFIVDMSELDTVYRIGSFLVLGVLLVAASFLYQRARAKEEPPPES